MWLGFAISGAIAFGLAQLTEKFASLKYQFDQYLFLGFYCAGALFFLMVSGNKIFSSHSPVFVLFAVFIALGSYLGNWAFIKAPKFGSSNLMFSLVKIYLLPIILMSVLFYDEKLSFIKILTILILFMSLILVHYDKDKIQMIKNKIWYFYVAVGASFLFLRDGGLKITQEIGFQNTEILFFSYFISIIFIFITMYILFRQHKKKQEEFILPKRRVKSFVYGIFGGVFAAMGLYWYCAALMAGPASLVALVFSARSFVWVFLSWFLQKKPSFFFLKQKLSKFQIIAVILLFVGLILAKTFA